MKSYLCLRNCAAGICLALIKEFDKALYGEKYSVLPIVRICESNPTVAHGLDESRVSKLSSLTSLAENMLKRTADMPTASQEVITRVGLGPGTVDGSGNQVLCRPTNKHREALDKASKGSKRKAPDDQVLADKRALNKLTMQKLKDVAAAENVVLPERARLLKLDIVDAILQQRKTPLVEDLEDDVEEEMRAEASMNVVATDACDQESETVAKKILQCFTNTELLAIALKENVVLGPGTKVKMDYVNAIYLARHPASK